MAKSAARIQTQTETTFTSAEAAKISGVSPEVQRDWRRHKFLPVEIGHARYEPRTVAQLMLMRVLGEHELGPSRAKDIAKHLSRTVFWHALANLRTAIAVKGPAELVGEFLREFGNGTEYLNAFAGVKNPLSGVIIYRNGKVAAARDLAATMSEMREAGEEAVRLLDVEAIGHRLAKDAGRALLTIEVGKAE